MGIAEDALLQHLHVLGKLPFGVEAAGVIEVDMSLAVEAGKFLGAQIVQYLRLRIGWVLVQEGSLRGLQSAGVGYPIKVPEGTVILRKERSVRFLYHRFPPLLEIICLISILRHFGWMGNRRGVGNAFWGESPFHLDQNPPSALYSPSCTNVSW
jgi:hypothetical protein